MAAVGWQARRTVQLYERYKGRVRFVIVDLDAGRSAAQAQLVRKFYRGYIPHVTILVQDGKVLYNVAGEVEESTLASILDKALK